MSESIDLGELRDSMRVFLDTESNSRAVRAVMDGDAAYRASLWSKISDLGWLGLAIEEKYGGSGLGFAELTMAYEEFGRALTPLPFLSTLLSTHVIGAVGSDEQKSDWLPALARGEVPATIGIQGFNGVVQMTNSAGGVRLRGSLSHLPDAAHVVLLLVPVVTMDFERCLALVDRSAAGVTVSERATIDRSRSLCDVTFSDVTLPLTRILRPTVSVWDDVIDHASVAIACDSVGGTARILEMTIEYLKTRVQFDRVIGSFQSLKHRCAQWKILQEASAALATHAGALMATGVAERHAAASSAKFYASDAYAAIAGDAVQLHGGIGFTWDHDCHLFLKRAKLNQQLFGSSTQHRERVAERIFPDLRTSEEFICT